MASNHQKSFLNEYDYQVEQKEKYYFENKQLKATVVFLNHHIIEQNNTLLEKDKTIENLKLEVERLNNNANKDSSNSGIPSSQNRFKKNQNSRTPSNKSKGGQKGHKGTTSDVVKVKKLIETGKVEHEILEINKNIQNEDKEFKVRYVHDIKISSIVREYRYYPDEKGHYHIPKEQINTLTYGNNLKGIGMLLVHRVPASLDQTVSFINAISNDIFKITKATLDNWTKTLAGNLEDFLDKVKEKLLSSPIVNTDESPINVNGKNYQIHSYSNDKLTLQYVHKSKSKAAIKELNFLTQYFGTLVHDHNMVQYNYGIKHAECNAHILRYIKSITDFTSHKWSLTMSKLLKDILHQKHLLQEQGVSSFDSDSLGNYSKEYDEVLALAKKEYVSDYDSNSFRDEERKLITRLKEFKKNHLLFMYDFNVPFTNNRAEADIRPAKMKQKVGIFRSESGASAYIAIRSFISTSLKNDLDIFDALKCALVNKNTSFCLG